MNKFFSDLIYLKTIFVLCKMSLFVSSLNSGSNGNCYYIGNEQEAVLIDAGISCREIEQRMANLKLSVSLIKAVFISHEHIDHIRGIAVFAKKYELPVYITPATSRHTGLRPGRHTIVSFNEHEPVSIGELSVIPFSKQHDANDPFSFIIEHKGVRVGVITDIGIACKWVIHYFKQCHACFLESNYDEQMLEEGGYPLRLKNRIRGGKGHLSNSQALELFKKHRPSFMTHLFLSHISKNNNTPELVTNLFAEHAGETSIVIASRYKETDIYRINRLPGDTMEIKLPVIRKESVQLKMFA
jgi:phosphoribosyl 1,2-cyclic phosphodiesterase